MQKIMWLFTFKINSLEMHWRSTMCQKLARRLIGFGSEYGHGGVLYKCMRHTRAQPGVCLRFSPSPLPFPLKWINLLKKSLLVWELYVIVSYSQAKWCMLPLLKTLWKWFFWSYFVIVAIKERRIREKRSIDRPWLTKKHRSSKQNKHRISG